MKTPFALSKAEGGSFLLLLLLLIINIVSCHAQQTPADNTKPKGKNTAMDNPVVRPSPQPDSIITDMSKNNRTINHITQLLNQQTLDSNIRIYRVKRLISSDSLSKVFSKYPILQEKKLTITEAEKLKAIMHDSLNYLPGKDSKLSLFLPDVGIAYGDSLEVLLSFRSNEIQFKTGNTVFVEDIEPGLATWLGFLNQHLDGLIEKQVTKEEKSKEKAPAPKANKNNQKM